MAHGPGEGGESPRSLVMHELDSTVSGSQWRRLPRYSLWIVLAHGKLHGGIVPGALGRTRREVQRGGSIKWHGQGAADYSAREEQPQSNGEHLHPANSGGLGRRREAGPGSGQFRGKFLYLQRRREREVRAQT